MASIVIAQTISVTTSDVLYVDQQITRDLRKLHTRYPKLLSGPELLDLADEAATFLVHDAIDCIGFSILDPRKGNLVYYERRYEIEYAEQQPRSGTGGLSVPKLNLPRSSIFKPWVQWSERMLRLTPDKQQLIVAPTGWSRPGRNRIRMRYEGGVDSHRATYRSGSLIAHAREYQRT